MQDCTVLTPVNLLMPTPSSIFTVSADDTYSIHFVKRVKVVHIVDIHNQQYSVPVNSSVEFGLVYDSNKTGKGTEDSLSGKCKDSIASDT